jgi:hypothetical protein
MSDPGGVDLTPLYRAAARAQMIQGAIGIVIGAIMALVGIPVVGLVLIPVGFIRLLYGLYGLYKCRAP